MPESPPTDFRPVCWRCRRPQSACYCAQLPSLETRTRVVFLQHPRERYVAIGTARMAHLSLPNSEFHLGTDFSAHPRLQELAASKGVALLFPGEGARDLSELSEPLQTLVVVDGTWPQARKLVSRNPVLAGLPRLRFQPQRPGNYRIRREPAEHCVSTLEAVVEVLSHLEPEPERFQALLRPFDWMVDLQLARRASRTSPPRRKLPRERVPAPALPPELLQRREDLVLLYAEANSHPRETTPPIPSELVQLVACRPHSGERFQALLAPRQPLAASTPHHLGIPEAMLRGGEPAAEALARFRAFLRPTDLLAGWGPFALDLLEGEGEPAREWLDLRRATARLLKRRAGGIEAAAELLCEGAPGVTWAAGRAGLRVAELERLLGRLQALAEAGVREVPTPSA